jgi:hypothetical protein
MVPNRRVDWDTSIVPHLVDQIGSVSNVRFLFFLALHPDIVWRVVASPHNEVELFLL